MSIVVCLPPPPLCSLCGHQLCPLSLPLHCREPGCQGDHACRWNGRELLWWIASAERTVVAASADTISDVPQVGPVYRPTCWERVRLALGVLDGRA